MSDWEILHRDHDRDGNLTSLLVLEDGEPTQKNAIPENILLYEHGLKDFFEGDNLLQFSESVYGGSRAGEGYILVVDGDLIEIPPRKDHDFLQAIADILDEDRGPQALRDIHQDIIAGQVRRHIINNLTHSFGKKAFDIQVQGNGWLIEDAFLVDWNANIYTKDDDPEDGDYIREFGSGITKTDKSYQFVELDIGHGEEIPEAETVDIGEKSVTLTDKEMEFLAKVTWLLGRWKYHPDEAFWAHVENQYDIE